MDNWMFAAGILLMIITVILFLSIQDEVNRCGSIFGEFAQSTSNEASSACQFVKNLQIFLAVFFVIGLGLTIRGAVGKPSKIGKIISIIVLVIESSILAQMILPFPFGLVTAIVIIGISVFLLKRKPRKSENS